MFVRAYSAIRNSHCRVADLISPVLIPSSSSVLIVLTSTRLQAADFMGLMAHFLVPLFLTCFYRAIAISHLRFLLQQIPLPIRVKILLARLWTCWQHPKRRMLRMLQKHSHSLFLDARYHKLAFIHHVSMGSVSVLLLPAALACSGCECDHTLSLS